MENIFKLVEFENYCHKCEFKDAPDYDEPCNECLTHTVAEYSHKPIKFKEERHAKTERMAENSTPAGEGN